MNDYRHGYVFDLDGLLVNTQTPFHACAECQVLKEYGITMQPEELSARFAGRSVREVFAELAPDQNPDELVRRKWALMPELLARKQIEALPEMLELCRDLNEVGIPIAIASASPASWIRLCLQTRLDVEGEINTFGQIFGDRYVSAEDCKRPKPAPDVFLAAQALAISHADPKAEVRQWFAVGDGESDVLAGIAAKMHILFLSESNQEFDDRRSLVNRCATSNILASTIRAITLEQYPEEWQPKELAITNGNRTGVVHYHFNTDNTKLTVDSEDPVLIDDCTKLLELFKAAGVISWPSEWRFDADKSFDDTTGSLCEDSLPAARAEFVRCFKKG